MRLFGDAKIPLLNIQGALKFEAIPLFFRPLISRNQLSQLIRSDFTYHLRGGEMSDQALLADEHLSADYRIDEAAVCHMAVQCSDRYAGQLRCQLARHGVGVVSPSLLQIFTQCLRFAW